MAPWNVIIRSSASLAAFVLTVEELMVWLRSSLIYRRKGEAIVLIGDFKESVGILCQ